MSSSPHGELPDNNFEHLAGNHPGSTSHRGVALDGSPPKRGRGRPKGSKNKKPASTSAAVPTTTGAVTPEGSTGRKRGRPPKEKKADDSATDAEPTQKRKRGRPPKNPKPDMGGDGGANGDAVETSTKRKRGRPPKQI